MNQIIKGIVRDSVGNVLARMPVEVQFDNGLGGLDGGVGVRGLADLNGAFQISVVNNASETRSALIRLGNGDMFSFELNAVDAVVDLGYVNSGSGSGSPHLYEGPGATQKSLINLNQSSDEAPDVIAVLDNSLGSPVWTRLGVGSYAGTLAGAFPQAFTYIESPVFVDNAGDLVKVYWHSVDEIRIAAAADGRLSNAKISIIVYPS